MGSSDRNGAKSKQGKSPVESYEESLSTGLNQKKIFFFRPVESLWPKLSTGLCQKHRKLNF
jgi:hypothetical protein